MSATPETVTPESPSPEPEKKFPHRWELVGWVGTGLVIGTVLLAFLVLWRLEGEDFGIGLLALEEGRGVWQVPLAVALVVALTVFNRDRRELSPDPVGPVTPTFFVFLGLSLLILLLVLLANLPTSSFVFTAGMFDEPYRVEHETVALWSVPVALLLGIVLLLVSHRWPRTRPWKWWAAPLAVGVVLALLVDPAVRALSEYVPTEHSSLAEAPDEPAPFPSSVTQPGWEWQAPEGTTVLNVERGPLGPVIAITDGLVGLDGQTGEELWSYRRPLGDVSTALQPGADRAHVVLHSGDTSAWGRDGSESLRGGQVTLLDTSTGQIVEEFESVFDDLGDRSVHVLPEFTVRFVGRETAVHLSVWGIEGTNALWGLSLEPGAGAVEEGMVCGSHDPKLYSRTLGSNLLVQGDQLLFGYRCADPADFEGEWEVRSRMDVRDDRFVTHLVSLDLRTGEENWRRTWDDSDAASSQRMVLRDGGPVLNMSATPAVVMENLLEGRLVVLDAADGSDVVASSQVHGVLPEAVHADTGGVVVNSWPGRDPDQEVGEEDIVLERLETSGEVTGVIRLPVAERTGEHSFAFDDGAVGLSGGVVLPFLDSLDTDEGGTPSLVAAPFQDTDPGLGESTGEANLLGGAVESWERHGGSGRETRTEAVLVPGAVVTFVSEQSEHVYGWQP